MSQPDPKLPGPAPSDPGGSGSPVLAADRLGHGPPLVLAHGFTQTRRIWGGIDRLLAADRTVVRVDLPGHGGSGRVATGLVEGAARLGDAGGVADYLGYSMGARYCLHVAVERPDLVRRLVLISGTAGIADAGEREARRRSDDSLADRLDPSDGGPPLDTVEEFVTRWVSAPMFGAVPADAVGLSERLTNRADGLASSLRLAGAGTQEPLWDRLHRIDVPVLVVTGAKDAKFSALGTELVGALGTAAVHETVPDADHAPHLQRPDRVADVVRSFLDD